MERIFITGTNRGIGLSLVRQYLEETNAQVFATCRNPAQADKLNELRDKFSERLTILQLDVNDDEQIHEVANELGRRTTALDVIINNAGIYPEGAPTREFGSLLRPDVMRVVETNAISALMVTQALYPLLKRGENKRIIMVSSHMGSLERGGGRAYAYRMSKAAMNMAARTLANDLEANGVTTITLHPGYVSTTMGGPGGAITPDESAAAIRKIAQKLQPSDNGMFFNYTGDRHSW